MDSGPPGPSDSSKSEQAYQWIRSQISSRQYAPGFRLVLGSIAGELGMSVVPVREAIRRLEAEGIVTFLRNVGAQVALVDENDYVFTMQTLATVEGTATALSAPQLTAADLERAEALNQQMASLLDDLEPEAFTRLNQEFHAVLYGRCTNPHLLELVRSGWARLTGLRHSTFEFVPGRSRDSVAEHNHILELIRAHADALQIDLAVRNHRWRTVDAFLAARHSGTPSPDPTEGLTHD